MGKPTKVIRSMRRLAGVLTVGMALVFLMVGPAGAQARPMLRLGSSGESVLVLEQRLVELGFDPGSVDEVFDSATRTAVVEFQRTARIGADGIVGPVTWGRLDDGVHRPDPDPDRDPDPRPPARPMLRLGSSGEPVLVLEQRLVELGFDPGSVDRSFDRATRSAVVEFQRTARIGADGIVGPVTWGRLDDGVHRPNPDPNPDPDPDPDDDQDPNPDPDGGEMVRRGDTGPAVRAVQERLLALGYWLPAVDGRFGADTHHAVVALQKAAGLSRDGVVGPRTRSALDAGVRPVARTGGDGLEVDLGRQLLLVVRDGRVTTIYDTSTGRVSGTTPVGSHRITRQIDGYRYAPLGTLYRPKYFIGGVAIHGYPSVPNRPASHGCVRVTNRAMDHLWSSGIAPVGASVIVYR